MNDRTSILSELSMENDVKWEPDGKICKLCQRKFGYLQNRRHHCRTCGILICENCSFFKDVILLNNTSIKKIRLCAQCMEKCNLEEEQRMANSKSDSVNNTIELTASPPNSPYKIPNDSRISLLSVASFTPERLTPVKDLLSNMDEILTIPLTDEKQPQIIFTSQSLSLIPEEDIEENHQCELCNCELFQFWK